MRGGSADTSDPQHRTAGLGQELSFANVSSLGAGIWCKGERHLLRNCEGIVSGIPTRL
jgi:hypothetical protein